MRRRKNEWQLLAVVAANGRRVWAAYQAQKLFTHVTLACEGRMVKVNVRCVDGEVDVVWYGASEDEVCGRGHEVRSEVAGVEMEVLHAQHTTNDRAPSSSSAAAFLRHRQ